MMSGGLAGALEEVMSMDSITLPQYGFGNQAIVSLPPAF